MSCEYVKQAYGVPAEIGRRISFNGRQGVIAADRGNYIGVNFDDEKPGLVSNLHPTWQVEYLGIGKVRKMSRSQRRYQHYLGVSDCYENFLHYLQSTEFRP